MFESSPFFIEVYEEKEVESREVPTWVLPSILTVFVLSLLIATFLQYLQRER